MIKKNVHPHSEEKQSVYVKITPNHVHLPKAS